MNISAKDVKDLREKTGLGMMECKKALEEAGGDSDLAITNLRKNSALKAEKKSSRTAVEGVILSDTSDSSNSILIEINCETDFVAKNSSYLALAKSLADQALKYETLENFLSSDFDGMSVSEKLIEQTGVIGEKIEIGAFKKLTAPYIGSYIHAGNKIATLVGLSGIVDNAAEISKNIAMQAAAMNPIALDEESVDALIIQKEIEIAKEQLRQEGKPEDRNRGIFLAT